MMNNFLKIIILYFVFCNANAQVVWNSENLYQKGAVVLNDGVAYIALSRNLNKVPKQNAQYWVPRSMYSSSMQSVTVQPVNPVAIGYSSDLNFGLNQSQATSQNSKKLEPWSSAYTYNKGRIVTFDNAIWRASYWTQGEAPGTSEAWVPTVTTKWTPHIAYTKGQAAIYNGITYTAQWWTKGDVPLGDKTGVWIVGLKSTVDLVNTPGNSSPLPQTTGSVVPNLQAHNQIYQYTLTDQKINPNSYTAWRADIKYSVNALVSYADAVWRKSGNLDTRTNPSEDGQWVPITTTKWYPKVPYEKGMTVKVDNTIWYSQWYNVNIYPPKDETGVWVEVDLNGNRVFTSERSEYSSTHVYVKGDKCMHGGHSWISMYWNQSEIPGTTAAWVPLVLTKWYSNVAYDPKEVSFYRYHVTYNGIQWEALWWTKGDIPSKSSVWKPLGLTDWISAFAYNAKDEVIYDGAKWRAQWWTQGEVPLDSEVWEPLTASNWSAKRAYVAGNQVKYNGGIWTAQWWTKADTPGASNVWKKS